MEQLTQIYVVHSSKSFTPPSDIFVHIHAGKALSKDDFGFLGDDSGDNISVKNPYYSELTATYWIWKNVKADVVGLYHYRRYFNLKDNNSHINIYDKNFLNKTGNNQETVQKLMKEYDIILPYKTTYYLKNQKEDFSTYDLFIRCHPHEAIDTALDVIKEKYPESFDIAYKALQEKTAYYKNMLIAKKEVFDDYAKWLFSILFEVEKRIHNTPKDLNEQRLYGYLSERMMNIYIKLHPELRVKEVPMIENTMPYVKNIIVGCGLSGIVMAERIANELKEQVLIIDRRDHIAGNIFDYNEKGITIHKYGPHVFHTKEKYLWDYVQKFSEFNTFQLRVSAWIDGQYIPIPFNFNSIEKVFPTFMAERIEKKLVKKFGYDVKVPILELKKENDTDLQFLANFIYKNVFEGYTLKQWGLKPEEINPSVMERVPIFIGRDDRYFQDAYQGIPVHGYTKMMEKMLDNPLITVYLKTDWTDIKDIKYDRLFYTGSIDEFFDYSEGQLPYRSVYFKAQEYDNVSYMQPTATVNYSTNYEWTRICEPKYFLNEQTAHTVLMREYSEAFEQGKNERYYPIETPQNMALFAKYQEKSQTLKNVYFLGRLGDYKYYNMDQCIARALNLFNTINKKPLVSFILPNYNNAHVLDLFFTKFLENNTYDNYEFIVVDDGSMDNGLDVLKKWKASGKINNMQIIAEPHKGIGKIINKALFMAKGEFIIRCDGDATLESKSPVEKFLEFYNICPEKIGVITPKIIADLRPLHAIGRSVISPQGLLDRGCEPTEPQGKRTWDTNTRYVNNLKDIINEPAECDMALAVFTFCDRETALKIGGFDKNYNPVWMEDDDFYLSFRKYGKKCFYLPTIKILHRWSLRGNRNPNSWNKKKSHFNWLFSKNVKGTTREYKILGISAIEVKEENLRKKVYVFGIPVWNKKYLGWRPEILLHHYKYWKKKWGFDCLNPDMEKIKLKYKGTELLWQYEDDKKRLGEDIIRKYKEKLKNKKVE